MFGLSFRFPAGRYHATPWGRNVNEADVAWPPEPWRILRALVATYWRKGDRERWVPDDLARLVEMLAAELPVFRLPEGAVHAHTRHYMPTRKGKAEAPTLVFDAFLHLPKGVEILAVWSGVSPDGDLMELARNLATGIGYLGRAESWTECRVVSEPTGEPNCAPAEPGASGDLVRVLVPRSAAAYSAERRRLLEHEGRRIRGRSVKALTEVQLRAKVDKAFRVRGKRGADTLPEQLLDALSLDTADLRGCGWSQPPAAYEAVYARSPEVAPGVLPRRAHVAKRPSMTNHPTVARYLVAGRPRPRIEDAVKIGDVMRKAALSKFWDIDDASGKRVPCAPWQISGRDEGNRPLRDPSHPHAFWLPEDAHDDGWIDHIVVYIAGGMDRNIRSRLDRITRIWLGSRTALPAPGDEPGPDEWRLALEGFGHPKDFEGGSRILATSRRWRSITPFLAPGHLKKAGHSGEVLRLLRRRGFATDGVSVEERREVLVGGTPRRALNFHRFRSRGHERRHDSTGALLEIEFPEEVRGPLALGYGSHFGLGMFGAR